MPHKRGLRQSRARVGFEAGRASGSEDLMSYPTVEEKAALWDAVECACERLPDGWHIEVSLEGGAATLCLWSADAAHCVWPRMTDEPLAEQIKELVEVAVMNTPA